MKFRALSVVVLLVASAHAEMPCSVMDDLMGKCGSQEYGADLKATVEGHLVQTSCYKDNKMSYLVGQRGEYAEYHEVTKKGGEPMPELPPSLGTMEYGPLKTKLLKLESMMNKAKALAEKAAEIDNS